MKQLKLIGLALGASLALSTAALAQDITIAVAGPMTGGESAFGRQMKNGAEQAITDMNAAGGVLGKKLALEVGDDACDPKQARSVAEKIGGMKIPFVAGHYCSSSSIPASEAYAENNVLQISPGSRMTSSNARRQRRPSSRPRHWPPLPPVSDRKRHRRRSGRVSCRAPRPWR